MDIVEDRLDWFALKILGDTCLAGRVLVAGMKPKNFAISGSLRGLINLAAKTLFLIGFISFFSLVAFNLKISLKFTSYVILSITCVTPCTYKIAQQKLELKLLTHYFQQFFPHSLTKTLLPLT